MAYPLVCLATDRTFNFSKFIFNNMMANVKSSYKFLMYPRFVQSVLNEFPLQTHKRVYKTPCLKPKVFQNMSKASELWNGEVKPLFPEMLSKISQVHGEDATIPVVSHHSPSIVVPPIQHTLAVAHTYERRNKQPPSPITTLPVSEPFGLGSSSGGSRLHSSSTREDPESMPYESPLPTGNTVGSVEGSVQPNELMGLYTNLVKQVKALEKELAQTKQHHATELAQMKAEIKNLQEEVEGLKKQRSAKIVFSSSSSPQEAFSDDLGDSSKQGRKTDAETKGRKIDFGDDYGLDADFYDTVGITQPISTAEFQVPTARQDVTTAEEEAARIRTEKGKAVMTSSEQVQPRKVSRREQAQISYDAELAKKLVEDEVAKKKKQEELDIGSFMEAQRLDKLETVLEEPISIVPPTVLKEKPPMFTYVPTEQEIEFMIANDPVRRKKAAELIANTTLTEDQRSAQLKDFIEMKNQQALDDIIGTVRKGQKKSRQPTKTQIIAEMKTFCCHVGNWKMAQFNGMSHDQIEGIYYRVKRQDSNFIPMDLEPEVKKSKRS